MRRRARRGRCRSRRRPGTRRAPSRSATSTSRTEFDEFARADHEHEVALARDRLHRLLAVLRGVADVVGLGPTRAGNRSRSAPTTSLVSSTDERGLREEGDPLGIRRPRASRPRRRRSHERDRVGRLAQRALDLLVAGVADQEDPVALGREPARLGVHLGDERAGGVDHRAGRAAAASSHRRARRRGRRRPRSRRPAPRRARRRTPRRAPRGRRRRGRCGRSACARRPARRAARAPARRSRSPAPRRRRTSAGRRAARCAGRPRSAQRASARRRPPQRARAPARPRPASAGRSRRRSAVSTTARDDRERAVAVRRRRARPTPCRPRRTVAGQRARARSSPATRGDRQHRPGADARARAARSARGEQRRRRARLDAAVGAVASSVATTRSPGASVAVEPRRTTPGDDDRARRRSRWRARRRRRACSRPMPVRSDCHAARQPGAQRERLDPQRREDEQRGARRASTRSLTACSPRTIAAERGDREDQPVQVVVDVEVAGEAGAGELRLVPACRPARWVVDQPARRRGSTAVAALAGREQREQRPGGLRRRWTRRDRASVGST